VEDTLLLITVTVNMYVSPGVKLFIVTELSLPRGTSSTEGGEHGELHLTSTFTESHTVLGLLHVIIAVLVLLGGDNSAVTLITGEGSSEEREYNTLTTSYTLTERNTNTTEGGHQHTPVSKIVYYYR